jgi:mono/diheme cytochrome c family protein
MKNNIRKYYTDIKKNPGKIFGLVYIYIFTIGLFLGIYYAKNMSLIARQSVFPGVPDTTVKADIQPAEARIVPPVNLELVRKPDQAMLDNGKSLYASACVSCHGEKGMGNGPAGAAINPPPKDFTRNDGWKNGTRMTDLYKTLEEGIPGTAMISYNYMPPGDRVALSHFMRESFIPNPPAITEDEVKSMEQTYNLSAGGQQSAQIPVSSAMEVYMQENRSKTERIINSIRELSGRGEGSELFLRVTSDRVRAVTSLSMNTEWLKDMNRLKSQMATGINMNGFNSEVLYLDEDEWKELHNYLVSIF